MGSLDAKKAFAFIFCVSFFLNQEVGGTRSATLPKNEGVELTRQLKIIKKNTVKIIKTADGDVFDCVDMYKQTAFSHPLLKDHKLQMRPSSHPRPLLDETSKEKLLLQIELNDGGCPQGSVPIQRLKKDALIREKSTSTSPLQGDYKNNVSLILERNVLKWAEIQTTGEITYGAAAAINVYGVPNVRPLQISSSTIYVVNRKAGALLFAGWTVHPTLFNDTNTRQFISWSTDGGASYCYNLFCPGFIQTSPSSPVGGILQPVSVYRGQQYAIRNYIFKDKTTGNWWFSFGNPSNFIGYWPREIFHNFDSATETHYGGFTTCPAAERCPPMGNGVLPSDMDDAACFISEVRYFDENMYQLDLLTTQQSPYANRPDCYNVGSYRTVGGLTSHIFTFGGPGCY